jgi:hypothetical protein
MSEDRKCVCGHSATCADESLDSRYLDAARVIGEMTASGKYDQRSLDDLTSLLMTVARFDLLRYSHERTQQRSEGGQRRRKRSRRSRHD